MTLSPKLQVLLMQEGQLDAEVLFNDFLVILDALIGIPEVLTFQINTPPASPVNGDIHVVGTVPTGAWVGQANKFAIYYSGWVFIPMFTVIIYDATANLYKKWDFETAAWTTALI